MEPRAALLFFFEESEVDIPVEFDDDTPLLSSGMLDSITLFNLVLWIEERIGHSIDPTKMDILREWDSVRRILDYIERDPRSAGEAGAAPTR